MANKDWIATLMFNNPSSLEEIAANGVTPDNVDLQSPEYYKEKKEVQEKFSKNGEFDEVQFNNFYNSALNMYNTFAEEDWTEKFIETLDKDPFDWTQPTKTNVKDVSATIFVKGANPERRSMGIAGIDKMGDPVFSIREIAQDNYVRDENGNKLDWTPNQHSGLFKSLLDPIVALAVYDEDGYHIQDGMKVFHQKGDYKLDEETGDFYYEVLKGDQESAGRDVLRWTDTFTVDGSTMNKFDFFDSDSLDKSIVGTIAKTTVQIAPYLFPGVNKVAGAIEAVTALGRALPGLVKSINGIVSTNDNAIGTFATKADNFFEKFSPTQSDKAREGGFWSTESIADIVSSSVKQLYSQKVLGNFVHKMASKAGAKDPSKLGQKLSLAYMAITSSEDSYSAAREAGASEGAAGVIALATGAALYKLMSADYFKDRLFKGTVLDESEAVDVLKNFRDADIKPLLDVYNASDEVIESKSKSLFNSAYKKALQWGEKILKKPIAGKAENLAASNIRPAWSAFSTVVNRATNEAIEETMEEVSSDIVKGIMVGLDNLGIKGIKDKNAEELDFGFTPSSILTRYGQSFIGGFIGGAIFEGMNKWENIFGPKVVSLASKDSKEQMLYLITTGRTQELLDRLEVMKDKGLLGNKNLSATKTRINSEGKTVFEKGTDTDNQNLYNYNVIKNYILYMNNTISKLALPIMQESSQSTLDLGKTYKDFREKQQTLMEDMGLKENQESEYLLNNKTNAFLETIKHFKLHTSYLSDLVEANRKIVDTTAQIDNETRRITPSTQEERKEQADVTKNEEHIKQLRERLNNLVEERNNLVSGRNDDIYANQALFIACKDIYEPFLKLVRGKSGDPTQDILDLYSFNLYGKAYNELQEFEKGDVNDRFNIKTLEDIDLRKKASDIYYKLLQALSPKVKETNEKLKDLTPNSYYDHSLTVYQSKLYKDYQNDLTDKLSTTDELNKVMKQSSTIIKQIVDKAVEKSDLLKDLKNNGYNFYDLETADEFFNSEDTSPKVSSAWYNARKEIDESIENNQELSGFNQAINELTNKLNTLDSKIAEYEKNQRVSKNIASNTLSEVGINDITKPIIALLDKKENLEKDIRVLEDFKQAFDEIRDIPDMFPTIPGVDLNAVNTKDDIDKIIEQFQTNRTETLNSIFQTVKDYYTTLKNNKIVVSNDDLVSQVISYVVDPILSEEAFNQTFNDAFYDIAESNQDYTEEEINNIRLKAYTYLKNLSIGKLSDSGYEDLVEAIGSNVEEADIKAFLTSLTDGVDVNKFIEDITKLKDGIAPLDTIDLVRDLKLSMDSSVVKVMELLKSEENTLRNGASIEDYVINDPLTRDALSRIPDIIELMDASLSAFNNGYTSTLNTFRKAASKEKLIDKLDDSTVKIFSSDLLYLGNKAATLNNLSDLYKARKSRFHIQSEQIIKGEFISSLFRVGANGKSSASILKEGVVLNASTGETVSIDLEKLWKDAGGESLSEVINDSNFAQYNEVLFKFSDLFYEEIKSKKLKGSDLGKLLTSLLDGSEFKRDYGHFSDKRDYKSTTLGVINFLSVISTIKLSDTYKDLRELYKKEDKIAPIFSQAWTILAEQSFLEDPSLYNYINSRIKESLKNFNAEEIEHSKYLSNLSVLNNMFFCQGGPGTGKTNVIDKLSLELYKKRHANAEIVLCAPHKTQLDNLSSVVNDKKAKSILLDDLISKICLSKPNYIEEFECRHSGKYKESDIKIDKNSTKDLFTGKDRVLVIDEVTFASEGDLQILSAWATSNNIRIITSGDKKQNGKRIQNNKIWAVSGIEDCIVASTLELTSTIRAENNAQQSNILGIGNLCNIGYNALLNNPVLGNAVSNEYKNPTLNIDYYEELGKTFVGGKIVTQKDITDHYIDEFATLSAEKGKVLIITDTPEKYKNVLSKYKNIEIMDSKSSQGGEFEYVIIDKNFSTDAATLYDKIKDLNTLISRAKIGFVIAKTDSLKEITIRNSVKSKEVANIPTDITASSETLKSFEESSHKFLGESTERKESTNPSKEKGEKKPTNPETPEPQGNPDEVGTTGSGETNDEVDNGEDLSDKDKAIISILAPSVDIDPEDKLEGYDIKESEVNEKEILERKISENKAAARMATARRKIQSTETELVADRLVFLNELENSESDFWKSLPKLISKFPNSLMGIDLNDEDQLRDYKSFIRLFSSGAIINMGFKDAHKRKLGVNASRISPSKMDSLCDYWNSQVDKKFVIIPYGKKLDRSIVFYAGKYIDDSMQEQNVLIPISTIQGNYKGVITLPKGKTLFRVTQEIQTSSSKEAPVDDLKYGTTLSSSRIFTPDSTVVGDPTNKLYSTYLNKEFKNNNSGKSFTVWSPIDILTDEDLTEVFQTKTKSKDGWSGPIFYTDVEQHVSDEGLQIIEDFYNVVNNEEASEEEIEVAKKIFYERKKGKGPISFLKLGQLQNTVNNQEGDNILAPVKLFATQRKITLAQLYNLSRIIHFIQGYIPFDSLTQTQKNLLGGGSDTSRSNAIRYMSSILGDFSYNLIATGDTEAIKENFAKLKDSYRLMTKGSAHNLLNGLWATFSGIANKKEASKADKDIYTGFINNLITILNSEAKKAKTTGNSNRICLTVQFKHPTSKKFKKFLIKKKGDGRIYIYPQDGYGYKNIPIDTNGIEAKGLSSDKIFQEIVNSIVESKSVEGYHKTLTIDNLKSGSILFDLTTEVVKDSSLSPSYYTPTDCDYVSRLLRGLNLSEIDNLEEEFRKSSYFKHGITLNDSGVRPESGSFWATMNQSEDSSIERTSDIGIMYPPTFIADISDYNFIGFDDSTEDTALQSAFTSGQVFEENNVETLSEFKENLLTSISETMQMSLDMDYSSIVTSDDILNEISKIENDTSRSADKKKQDIVNILNEAGKNGGLINGLEGLSINFDRNGINISRIEGIKPNQQVEEIPEKIQENLGEQEEYSGFFTAVNGNISADNAQEIASSVYSLYGKPDKVTLTSDSIIATWNNGVQRAVYLVTVDNNTVALSENYYNLIQLLSNIDPGLGNNFSKILYDSSTTKNYEMIGDFFTDNIELFSDNEEIINLFTDILDVITNNIDTLC